MITQTEDNDKEEAWFREHMNNLINASKKLGLEETMNLFLSFHPYFRKKERSR